MRHRAFIAGAALIVGISVLAVGCDFFGDSGVLKLNLTDAPLIEGEQVEGVHITVTDIAVHRDGQWIELEDFEPDSYNLLELTEGESALLGEFSLEAGRYTQIRFMIDGEDVENGGTPENPGSYIEFADGTEKPLFIPSGAQTGYKAVGNFDVPQNGDVEVTADFDVRRAVVKLGAQDEYILKPVLRLVVNDQAGEIEGSVSGVSDEADNVVVFAYEEGEYDESEAEAPENDDDTWFPNAVTSGVVNDNGGYVLPFLAEGEYTLVAAQFNEGELEGDPVREESVQVDAGETTSGIDISFD